MSSNLSWKPISQNQKPSGANSISSGIKVGKGLIILLHGVPGVGKTSTAETVAEYYNKPLLPITCGDLGLSPRDVEQNLESCFQMAQAWECVLLLDEADVFLTERKLEDVNRNALVSVFLRVLEYYEGVLFLTTNKVGTFDEAFKSRISMALYYAPLTEDQTVAIWKSQMSRVAKCFPEIKFNPFDLEFLAREIYQTQSATDCYKPAWNGRQIRNAFQTAISLAEFQCPDKQNIQLSQSHFKQVTNVSNQFNHYLWRVKHRQTDEFRNQKNEFRNDTFVPMPIASVPSAAPAPSFQAPYPSHPGQSIPTQPIAASSTAPPQPGQPLMNPSSYMPSQYNGQPQPFNNRQPQPQVAFTPAGQLPVTYQSPTGYTGQGQPGQPLPQTQGVPLQSQNSHSPFPSSFSYPSQIPVTPY
ncbi:P-loop containing nucleoside triphosphate hydrolase protein [Aspergillus coremiiformis]|uniref:P-loop containing nucleoside triphosphate hydrolase protein n=1 Tax=Aspergillus coremiiformis TaxID=138285 RepID=A0A5N6YXT3_9EURO|nr:P-loop containing nucleoside triphosphate hydrolase protein [Aspergillus coremiiformis]